MDPWKCTVCGRTFVSEPIWIAGHEHCSECRGALQSAFEREYIGTNKQTRPHGVAIDWANTSMDQAINILWDHGYDAQYIRMMLIMRYPHELNQLINKEKDS